MTIEKSYPNTPLDKYKHMKILIDLVPQHIIRHIISIKHREIYIYIEIWKLIYVITQTGDLANK